MNNFGSSEALFHADQSQRCSHCGFLFVAHMLQQMDKVLEMTATSPEWVGRFEKEDWDWIKARLDALVPISNE